MSALDRASALCEDILPADRRLRARQWPADRRVPRRRCALRARQHRPGERRERAVARHRRRPQGRDASWPRRSTSSTTVCVTGRCLEDPGESVNVYPVRAMDGRVWVSAEPQQARRIRAPAASGRHRQRHGRNAHGGGAAASSRPRLMTSPYSAPSRTATTTASCCRRCWPASSGTEDIILHGPEWYAEHADHAALGRPGGGDRPSPPRGALARRAWRLGYDRLLHRDRLEPHRSAHSRARASRAS